MTAGQNHLFAVGNPIRARLLDMVADRSRLGRGGRRDDLADRAYAPALGSPGSTGRRLHTGGERLKGLHDRRAGAIVDAERAPSSGKLGYESLHIARRRAAESVDGLPLVGNDPNIGLRRRERPQQARARKVHILIFIDKDMLKTRLTFGAQIG